VKYCSSTGLLCCSSKIQAVMSSLHVVVTTSVFDAGSPSAMVAAAGVMMTGAADVEAAAAMEVAASADALQVAGQHQSSHLQTGLAGCSLMAHFLSLPCHSEQFDSVVPAGFDCVSVVANHPRLGPLRSGVCWDAEAGAYVPDPLLRAVEPPVAGAGNAPCAFCLPLA
jgi:hypothetical protein